MTPLTGRTVQWGQYAAHAHQRKGATAHKGGLAALLWHAACRGRRPQPARAATPWRRQSPGLQRPCAALYCHLGGAAAYGRPGVRWVPPGRRPRQRAPNCTATACATAGLPYCLACAWALVPPHRGAFNCNHAHACSPDRGRSTRVAGCRGLRCRLAARRRIDLLPYSGLSCRAWSSLRRRQEIQRPWKVVAAFSLHHSWL
jgi:hypothetical protein